MEKLFWVFGRGKNKDMRLPAKSQVIIELLKRSEEPLIVIDLAHALNISPAGVCYHLRILEGRKKLRREKKGRKTECYLTTMI